MCCYKVVPRKGVTQEMEFVIRDKSDVYSMVIFGLDVFWTFGSKKCSSVLHPGDVPWHPGF